MDIDPTDSDTGAPDRAATERRVEEEEEEERPPDESTLMGVAGVQAQVEAESARAEAELQGEAPPLSEDGAEV